MLFNTIEFMLFFPIVTLLYYLLPHNWRWLMLLIASCVFYMWFIPKYIFILLVTIVIDYSAGLLMEKWKEEPSRRRLCLIVSIVSTCMVLFIFKYLNFCSENLVLLAKTRIQSSFSRSQYSTAYWSIFSYIPKSKLCY